MLIYYKERAFPSNLVGDIEKFVTNTIICASKEKPTVEKGFIFQYRKLRLQLEIATIDVTWSIYYNLLFKRHDKMSIFYVNKINYITKSFNTYS